MDRLINSENDLYLLSYILQYQSNIQSITHHLNEAEHIAGMHNM